MENKSEKEKSGNVGSILVVIFLIIFAAFWVGTFIPYDKPPFVVNVPQFENEKEFSWFVLYRNQKEGEYKAPPMWIKGRLTYFTIDDEHANISTLWKGGEKITIPEGPWTSISIEVHEKPKDIEGRVLVWSWKWRETNYTIKVVKSILQRLGIFY